MIVDGIACSEAIDSSSERILIDGLDCSDIEEGTVPLNWEHRGETSPGASPGDIVGKLIYHKKIYKESDCENERQLYFWKEVKLPYVYFIGRLFDKAGHLGASDLAAIIRDGVANEDKKIIARWSVEGVTLEKVGNVIKTAILKKLSCTIKPCNKSVNTGILSDPNAPEGFDKNPSGKSASKDVLDRLIETQKSELQTDSLFQKLGGSVELEYDPILKADDPSAAVLQNTINNAGQVAQKPTGKSRFELLEPHDPAPKSPIKSKTFSGEPGTIYHDYSHLLPEADQKTHTLHVRSEALRGRPSPIFTSILRPNDGSHSSHFADSDWNRNHYNPSERLDRTPEHNARTKAMQQALIHHHSSLNSIHPTSQRASKLEADTSQPGKVEYTGSPRKLELSELDMLKSYEGKGDSRGSANGAAVHSGETVFGSIKTPPTFSSIKAPSSKPAAESPMEAAFAGKQKADISKPKASVKQMARAIGRSQSVLARSEDYIDVKHENEKGKRLKNVGAAGTTPDDKKVQEPIKTQEGSGGDIKPNGLKKMDMKAPPAAPRAANSPSQKVAVSAKQPTMKNDDSWQAGLHEARTGVKDYKPNHGMDEFPKPTSKTPPRTPATIRYDIPGRIAKADLPSTKSPFPTPGKTPGNTIPPASGTIDTDVNQANKQIGGFKSILSNPTSGIKEGTGHLAALRSRASSKKIAP